MMLNRFLKYFSGSLIVLLVSVLSFSYMTSALTPEQYGELGLLLSIFSLLIPVISLSSNELIQVQFVKLDKQQYSEFYTTLVLLMLFVTFLVYIGIIITYYVYEVSFLIFLVPFLCLSRGVRNYIFLDLVIKKMAGLYGFSNVLIAILTLLITISLYVDQVALVEKRVAALFFGEVLVLIYIISKQKYKLSFCLNKEFIRKIITYGLPGVVASLPGWVLNESGRMSLVSEGYLNSAGLYTVAMQFAIIYLQFNSSLGNTLAKNVLEKVSLAKGWRFNCKIYGIQVFAGFIYLVAFLLFKDVLVNTRYQEISLVFSILLVGYVFQSMALVPDMVITYFERSDLRLLSLLLAAISVGICNYSFIPDYKEIGSALGLMFGFFTYSLSMFLASRYLFFINKGVCS